MITPFFLRPTWWRYQWYRLLILKCDIKIWLLLKSLYPVCRIAMECARFKKRVLS